MSRRRPSIVPRIPIFLGCEGESEQAYGQLLYDFIQDQGLSFHLEVVNLNPGAGDPISRVAKALGEITHRQRRRSEFRHKAILMDSDQVTNDRQRQERAERMARDAGISIIWQAPCHEALLLRHFPGYAQHRPVDSANARIALRRVCRGYEKPMTKLQLSEIITIEHIRRAAEVEPSFAAFLRQINLI